MNVSIPPDFSEFVQQMVAQGEFPNADEVFVEGLRLLQLRENLRQEVDAGIKQLQEGQWVDGDTVFANLSCDIDTIEKNQQAL